MQAGYARVELPHYLLYLQANLAAFLVVPSEPSLIITSMNAAVEMKVISR